MLVCYFFLVISGDLLSIGALLKLIISKCRMRKKMVFTVM